MTADGRAVRVLFMGTPDIAAECLRQLIASPDAEIVGAVTRPDRQKGRGMKTLPPPVKVVAEENGIPVFQPATLKDGAFEDELRGIDPDMIIVAAYGMILPPYVLNYPPLGCVNAHASLLPKYRGAAPINRAVMNGETKTGVTAMFMDEGLDTGDVIFSLETPVGENETAGDVHDRLAVMAGEAMCRVVKTAREGTLPRTPQPAEGATYAAKITKEDQKIDFSSPAGTVHNVIRGLSPYPGAFTSLPGGKLLKVTASRVADGSAAPPGTVTSLSGGITVACGGGSVILTEVIPEGRSKMDVEAFIRGRGVAEGDVLGADPAR